MSEINSTIQQLRAVRADYLEEANWHRFLLDAAYGTGGFRGKVGQPAISCVGWGADAYARIDPMIAIQQNSPNTATSYLDKFPRETDARFQRRVDVAHYPNYVGPLHELLVSYVNKGEMTYDEVPDSVEEWKRDSDGRGTTWDALMRDTVRPRAALLGWCPVRYDMPKRMGGPEVISQAARKELKIAPRATPLFPINILDWFTDEMGNVIALKLCTTHRVQGNLLALPGVEERYELWYPDRMERYTVRISASGGAEELQGPEVHAHDWGRVPFDFFRGKPTPDDRVRGASIVADLAVEARRLFNLVSELDDHIRNSVFPLLGVPVKDLKTEIGTLLGGNGGGVKILQDSNLPLHYVAPPASIAETLETRIEATVKEIYRIARVEYTKPTGQATSGVSRAYEFEATNRRLGDMASGFARAEERSLRLVAVMLGDQADKATVNAAKDFGVEDLAADIENVVTATSMDIGRTASVELRRRLLGRMLPNLPQETWATINDELDQVGDQEDQDSAMEREQQHAVLDAQTQAAKSGELAANPKAA